MSVVGAVGTETTPTRGKAAASLNCQIQINLNNFFVNYRNQVICIYVTKVQVHLKKLEYCEKVHFFMVTFQKVKLSYILDSLHVK